MTERDSPPVTATCTPGGHGRAWLSAAVLVTLAAPAAAQEERTSAPSLPEVGGARTSPRRWTGCRCSKSASPSSTNGCGNPRRRSQVVSPLTWNGYVDFGLLCSPGNGNGGVGWIRDDRPRAVPPVLANYAWVFVGDILGTPGEHPRRGRRPGRRAGMTSRYDSINSDGAASFILNEINLRPRYQLSDNAIMRASVNFAPAHRHRTSRWATPSTPTWPSWSTCSPRTARRRSSPARSCPCSASSTRSRSPISASASRRR